MDFLDFIEEDFLKKIEGCERIYIDENKHIKCFENAYRSFEPSERIRVIIDDSLFGSGKVGLIFTDKAIYTKEPFGKVFRDDISEIKSLDYTYQPDKQLFEFMINGKFAKNLTLSKFDFEVITLLISSYLEYIKVLAGEIEKIVQEKEKAKQEQIRQEKFEREKAEREKAEREKAEREKAEREKAEREKVEREKVELEKRTVSTEDGSSKVTRESVLKTYESDAMYDHIYRTRETLTSALFNYWGRASSDRDKLAVTVKNYFSHNLIYIRESSIDKYNIYQLKNDLATFEISLFLSKFLCGELQARGLNREQVLFVLVEGLNMLFYSVNNIEAYMQTYVTIIDEYLEKIGTQKIPVDDMFYMNILYTNITGNPLGIPMIDGLIEYYEVNSELCKNNARELAVIMRSNIDKFNFKYRWEVRERCAIEFNYIARTILGVNIIDNHRVRVMKENIDDIVKILRTMRVDLR